MTLADRMRRSLPRSPSPTLRALVTLESIAREYGPGLARRKRALLGRLERAALPSAAAVHRLHEAASFLIAYPDAAGVHRAAARVLGGFSERRDLRRFAPQLVGSGIAGTAIEFGFFSKMARWLASRWPERLAIDWAAFDDTTLLEAVLPLLAHPAEAPGLDEYDLGLRDWIGRMKGSDASDAAFLVRALSALPASPALREILYDAIDPPLVLAWGSGGPTRTGEVMPAPAAGRRAKPRLSFQTQALSRERPDLAAEAQRPPVRVRALTPAEGERYVDLARVAMVTRQRDLDAFANADARDVRLVEYEDGLAFACIGVRPYERLLLESVYGFMTLKNGAPIGYVLTSALYRSCEVAYNVFDTFRGAEAARVYARALAMSRHLFGADAFTIYPYQLGQGNDEAIESGAWWFYYKLGFRPKHRAVRRLLARELGRMRRDPAHRSSAGILRRLAQDNLYLHLGGERGDVIGRLPLAAVGLALTATLSRRYGTGRVAATPELAREARRALEAGSLAGWSGDERRAFDRWAPLVLALPGLSRWSAEERGALAGVIRAKGGRRESEFVRRFDAHPKLRAAVRLLAERNAE